MEAWPSLPEAIKPGIIATSKVAGKDQFTCGGRFPERGTESKQKSIHIVTSTSQRPFFMSNETIYSANRHSIAAIGGKDSEMRRLALLELLKLAQKWPDFEQIGRPILEGLNIDDGGFIR